MNIFWVNTILDHIDTIIGPPKYEGVFIPLLIKFKMFVDDNLFTFSHVHMAKTGTLHTFGRMWHIQSSLPT
jgi:hypothetical protein